METTPLRYSLTIHDLTADNMTRIAKTIDKDYTAIPENKGRVWTEEEVMYIAENYKLIPTKDIVHALKRDDRAIYIQVAKMKKKGIPFAYEDVSRVQDPT